jgi:hypothetical protein
MVTGIPLPFTDDHLELKRIASPVRRTSIMAASFGDISHFGCWWKVRAMLSSPNFARVLS